MAVAIESPLDGILGDLVTALAAASADTVPDAVTRVLREVTVRLRAEWTLVWGQERAESRPRAAYHAYEGRPPSASALDALLLSGAIRSPLEAGLPVWCSRLSDVTGAATLDAAALAEVRAVALLPVHTPPQRRSPRLTLVVGSGTRELVWPPAVIEHLRIIAAAIGQTLLRRAEADAARRMRAELDDARRAGRLEGSQRRPEARAPSWDLIASGSPAIRQALVQVEQVAPTSSTVLLLGETGVGKERFARAVHELSDRRARDMVRVSCAAIPATLIESELFGRERGAYTGALTRQIGRFELASGSTLFLDEIGELSAEVQAKLLRALESRVIERLGSTQPLAVDVRIVAATHRHLEQAVAAATFREDLFYRLNVFPIQIPPLRERVEDIPTLAWRFVDEFATAIGKSIHSIANESMEQLTTYSWPGNIRELRNLIERAVILAKGPVLTVSVPSSPVDRQSPASLRMKDVEVAHLRRVLESTRWRVRGKDGAAERLGLKPSTLETRMARLGLTRPTSS